ncbi:flavin reductase family protein [Actinoplanes sp. NPDC020271]|uniref:flavin reductase family protein n=1 Tax=Actinoplanes sp. NPDC020271 TaxID=3363896 RepID=UPI0037B98EE9
MTLMTALPMADATGPCSGTAFRAFMSHWPTGVSVVTTTDGEQPAGCTANAVMSVSLEPALLVVALGTASRTLAAVRDSGRFALNFLTGDQQHLCRRFATASNADRFQQTPYHWRHGVPVLDEVGAATVCRVHDLTECGDHVLVVGAPFWQGAGEQANPLVFYQKAYHDLTRR